MDRDCSKSEVLCEGVCLLEEWEKRLAMLDAAVARQRADARVSWVASIEEVARRLDAKHRKIVAFRA
ncbi:MAG: hypothetical protein FJX11_06275 [Alphaproteobacteria bacterium]|nr:hypothetical protein [Alphaproteobacteria bacterium]